MPSSSRRSHRKPRPADSLAHPDSGPFHSFTAVIGPNGAGKSNLMDAISFVLGVRSASLRSTALKDLIYRSGKKSKSKRDKGKGPERGAGAGEDESDGADEEDGDDEDGSEANGNDSAEDDDGQHDGERTAWVMAIYVDREEQKEWRFQRSYALSPPSVRTHSPTLMRPHLDSISVSGVSEYRINGKAVSYKRYNEQLEAFNILVKAKNFLVFQGDVEAVAAQSPKDLSRLVDQISGSLDLRDEYDRCAAALAKATEQSVAQHSRRKGVNSEVKQYQVMKTEAERWQALQSDRADAVVHHVVWKLFHLEEGIKRSEGRIEEVNAQLTELREENEQHEETARKARKEVNKAQKEVKQQDKLVREKEKELENLVSLTIALAVHPRSADTRCRLCSDPSWTVSRRSASTRPTSCRKPRTSRAARRRTSQSTRRTSTSTAPTSSSRRKRLSSIAGSRRRPRRRRASLSARRTSPSTIACE